MSDWAEHMPDVRAAEPRVNRQVRLHRRPVGPPTEDDFECTTAPIGALTEGAALIETRWLSIDPTHRVWMSERAQYMQPIPLGEVVRGFGIGRVLRSGNPELPEGALVAGLTGWQTHCVSHPATGPSFYRLPDQSLFAPTIFLGACGPSGVAAHYGLFDVAQAQPGECVVVTSAAGAVGSIVGQLAKHYGCRVVGVTAGEAKRRWALDLGFDAVVDRLDADWREALAQATPGGVDVCFENVGGAIMSAVLSRMNYAGRVALCGMIAHYNDDGQMTADFAPVLMQRLSVRGFQISDLSVETWLDAQLRLFKALRRGQLRFAETIIEGIENAPRALADMLAGYHCGKVVVKI